MELFTFFQLIAPSKLAYISSGVAYALLKFKRLGDKYVFSNRDKAFIGEGINFFNSVKKGIDPFESGARSLDAAAFGCYIDTRRAAWPDRQLPQNEEGFKSEVENYLLSLKNIMEDEALNKPTNHLDELISFFTELEEISLSEMYVRSQEQESPNLSEILM